MIDLYTAPTPNGWKASICLEELEVPYEVHVVNLLAGDQKKPEYVEINPNGRIPTIVDRDEGNFAVFESGAILIYLAEKAGRLLPSDRKGRSRVIQWLIRRLFEVLDARLADGEWLAGDYSIADIANWSWVRTYKWSGVNIEGLVHLRRWMDQLTARPACQKGVKVPFEIPSLAEEGTKQSAEEFAKGARTLLTR
jgi:glutathione S-transferase